MKVLVAGDFVPRHRVTNLIDAKDFSSVLGDVKPIIEECDFSIVNLEAPVIYGKPTPIEKTGPNLSCNENAVEALKWTGFNCVTLANNHFYDQGEQGVEGTLKACDKFEMLHVGAGKTLSEASQVLYHKIGDNTLAVINCCESEWSIASDKHGGSNPLNSIQQYYAIQEANQKADYVLVIIHGGMEGCQYPSLRMQETYRFFIDAGADVVVNHHQHCYCGYEVYHGKPIFYGLGNFCFDYPPYQHCFWNEGFMVELRFENGRVSYNLFPYNQCNELPQVHLMGAEEKYRLGGDVEKINAIISDDTSLVGKVNDYYRKSSKYVLSQFEPYKGRVLSKLLSMGLLPRFFKGAKVATILNNVRCESHQDKLLFALKNVKYH